VELRLPGPAHTLPWHPLIQCEAPATRLNGWSWEVGGQSTEADSLHFTCRNSAALNEKGEVDLLQPRSDFDPNPRVGTSIFLVW